MPCDMTPRRAQTAAERQAEVDRALDNLRRALDAGFAKYIVSPEGAVGIVGWDGDQRGGLSDVCAYRAMEVGGSWEHRQAVQRAEAEAGRTVSEQQVAAGTHSHDGGKTWGPGH